MNNDNNSEINQIKKSEDTPPILGSWNKLYSVVFISLIIMIMLFYFFTKAFE